MSVSVLVALAVSGAWSTSSDGSHLWLQPLPDAPTGAYGAQCLASPCPWAFATLVPTGGAGVNATRTDGVRLTGVVSAHSIAWGDGTTWLQYTGGCGWCKNTPICHITFNVIVRDRAADGLVDGLDKPVGAAR